MQIDFEKMQGLVPAIVQDADNGDILMLGFVNAESLESHLLLPGSSPFTRAPARSSG